MKIEIANEIKSKSRTSPRHSALIISLRASDTLSFAGMARQLHLSRSTIGNKAALIYERHNVPDRTALRQKLSPPQAPPLAASG